MSPGSRSIRLGRLVLTVALVCPAVASAQVLPQETVSLAGGRLTVGGDVTATIAPDDDGQFNYTDYERSALQLLRLGVTASFRPVERIALVSELRAEGDTNGGPWTALPFAAYVRVRPWKDRAFDIQAGRIPPVFGAAGRRIYANDNVLIGYPLAWQYLTVLRSDAVPSSASDCDRHPEFRSRAEKSRARAFPLQAARRNPAKRPARCRPDVSEACEPTLAVH